MKTIQTIPLIIITAALIACSSAETDWKQADIANTATAFQDFLKQHPNDAHAQQARDRLQKLEDDQAWAEAQKSNTMEAYQQDLQKEVNGAHVPEAHAQITGLERAAAWKTAQATNAQVPKARLKPGQSPLGADWPGGFWSTVDSAQSAPIG